MYATRLLENLLLRIAPLVAAPCAQTSTTARIPCSVACGAVILACSVLVSDATSLTTHIIPAQSVGPIEAAGAGRRSQQRTISAFAANERLVRTPGRGASTSGSGSRKLQRQQARSSQKAPTPPARCTFWEAARCQRRPELGDRHPTKFPRHSSRSARRGTIAPHPSLGDSPPLR